MFKSGIRTCLGVAAAALLVGACGGQNQETGTAASGETTVLRGFTRNWMRPTALRPSTSPAST
jgi:ABC-type glycerol-3-phosphate transport system substrate-binding protein